MWKLEVSQTNVTIALATGECGEDTGEVSPPVGGGGLGKFSYFRC